MRERGFCLHEEPYLTLLALSLTGQLAVSRLLGEEWRGTFPWEETIFEVALVVESSFSPAFYFPRESLFLPAGDISLAQGCGAGSEWKALEGLAICLQV
jgi:hypothetical protein